MPDIQRQQAAKNFVEFWTGKGYEKGESQKFWLALLNQVFGIANPETFITFEDCVKLDHASFIDGYIPSTHTMIEQKSLGIDLNKKIKQSDGTELTPYEQARRYADKLSYSKRPRWIVTCNFSTFQVYDMEEPDGAPVIIELADLEKDYFRLDFLVNPDSKRLAKEAEVSTRAGELVSKLYSLLVKQYKDPDSPESKKSLNILCVRLVFCLYAEDARIFSRNLFHDYLANYSARDFRKQLLELFEVLNTREECRDPYIDPELAQFPYTDGGLFAEKVEIPNFTNEIRTLLLDEMSLGFDWSPISPTIFGAMFESTLNPETRRQGGMHYTSIENIHKVIDPLFLDNLNEEFEKIRTIIDNKKRRIKLTAFQNKLASIKFLDPACGSGNFLTETYLCLRRLENKAILDILGGQHVLGAVINPIKVSLDQFYGIEINDFAVSVAATALWIAESQMLAETESIIHQEIEFLPLKSYHHIVEANALLMDWNSLLPPSETEEASHFDYIMGNPPYVGYAFQDDRQKEDLIAIKEIESKNIDYIAGWFYKSALLMQKNTALQAAFVSTNSICQGEQVLSVWKTLFHKYNIHIHFAYQTFVWNNEAKGMAHVHCVIVGFSHQNKQIKNKKLFKDSNTFIITDNINAYLSNGPNCFIEARKAPICNDIAWMNKGSQPTDGGNLLMSTEEAKALITSEPLIEPYVHKFVGADEFLSGKYRFCLWLKGVEPALLKKCPSVIKRIEAVKQTRLKSTKLATQKWAERPTLFTEDRQPQTHYILVPRVSSERREYVPMGFLSPDIIASDAAQIVPNATLFHFGILTSSVHMAWMRTVCGRLKSDYRYSNTIVYNTFPWPALDTATDSGKKMKARIELAAQGILDARAKYPNSSLADLYDPNLMPPELRKAHRENDKAVMDAYGFKHDMNDSEIVAELFKCYQSLVNAETAPMPKKKRISK